MGKMKELYMKIHYPNGEYDDIAYLRDDLIAQEREYLEYMSLQQDPEMNIDQTKIEVNYGEQTRIEVFEEKQELDRSVEIFGS